MSNADRCRRYRIKRHDTDMLRDMVRDMLRDMVPLIIQGVAEIIRHASDMPCRESMSQEKQESAPPIAPPDGFLDLPSPPPLNPPTKNTDATALLTKKRNEQFDEWWEVYPDKVGKGDAKKKYFVALSKTSADVLLTALERYKATKPAERPWCNPATWLNQERWLDVPASAAATSDNSEIPFGGPPKEPPPIPEGGFVSVGWHH